MPCGLRLPQPFDAARAIDPSAGACDCVGRADPVARAGGNHPSAITGRQVVLEPPPRAMLSVDEVDRAQDDAAIRNLGYLQLGAICATFEAAGIEFTRDNEAAGLRLRKST